MDVSPPARSTPRGLWTAARVAGSSTTCKYFMRRVALSLAVPSSSIWRLAPPWAVPLRRHGGCRRRRRHCCANVREPGRSAGRPWPRLSTGWSAMRSLGRSARPELCAISGSPRVPCNPTCYGYTYTCTHMYTYTHIVHKCCPLKRRKTRHHVRRPTSSGSGTIRSPSCQRHPRPRRRCC